MLFLKAVYAKARMFCNGEVPLFRRHYQKYRQDVDGDRLYIAGKRKKGL